MMKEIKSSLPIIFFYLYLVICSLAFFCSNSIAEDSEQLAQKISETTMSPFCPGRTLSACPSGEAKNLREKIIDWLNHGYSEQGVRNQLTMIYGKDVAGRPDFNGFGLVAWIVPGLFVLLGLGILYWWFKAGNQSKQQHATNLDLKSKYNDLIQAELSNRLR